MAFPSLGTTEWNELASAYLYKFIESQPKDQWSKKYPALSWIRSHQKMEDTGATWAWPLNDTHAFAGRTYTGFQQHTPADVKSTTMAEQAVAFCSVAILMSHTDEVRVGGGGKLFDLLENKTKQTKLALEKEDSRQLWATSLGTATDFQSIPLAIPVDPTADVAFNNVSGAAAKVPSWRNATRTSTGSWSADGIDKLDSALNEMAEYGGTPEVLFTTRTIFGFMQKNARGYLQNNAQVTTKAGKQMADLGIPVLYHNSIPIVADPDCLTQCIFGMSADAIQRRTIKGADYQMMGDGFEKTMVAGVHGSIAYLALEQNLCVYERRNLLRINGITAA